MDINARRLTTAAVLLVFASTAYAGGAGSAACTKSLTVVQTTSLQFGGLLDTGAAGGTVQITTDGQRLLLSGTITLSGIYSPALFDVTSSTPANCQNMPLMVSLPQNVTLSDAAGNKMTASSWTWAQAGTTNTTVYLDATGYAQIAVGADLAPSAGQVAGSYTGSFSITVKF